MNAIQFIQQYGVEKAREVVSKHAECYMPEVFKYWSEQLQDYVLAPKYASCLVSDIKRLVESMELIKCFDDLEQAKSWLSYLEDDVPYIFKGDTYDNKFYKHELKQAIADYEAIGGEHV